jgi:hypothetical protein
MDDSTELFRKVGVSLRGQSITEKSLQKDEISEDYLIIHVEFLSHFQKN